MFGSDSKSTAVKSVQVDPGANGNWDWTAWTAIKIE